MQHSKWIVIKFGGTSVSSKQRWDNIHYVLTRRLEEGFHPVVVCSALSGVTDSLVKLLAAIPDPSYRDHLARVEDKYRALAAELNVDADALLGHFFAELDQLTRGATMIGEVSPRLRAKVTAFGELMSTTLGWAYLRTKGLNAHWKDVREVLRATDESLAHFSQHYLNAQCGYMPNEKAREFFAGEENSVFITQGFIARDDAGDTVLLGRGGSDTSASYLAAILSAERCEIWTDVLGIYSANPRLIPEARLLNYVTYEEAQEITSLGAEVLHPRCLQPVAENKIPLHIRCTFRPRLKGTVIAENIPHSGDQVKAIVSKDDITLISIESPAMWHKVGFLADIFQSFKHHGMSINLVSTSETNVTISLDKIEGGFHNEAINLLIGDLKRYGQVRKIESCSSVSLVGRNIRNILHKLGDVFEVFEDALVYQFTQAANDLNLSFVVDEEQAPRLLVQLHRLLFEHHRHDALLGKTWSEVFEENGKHEPAKGDVWWHERRDDLLALADAQPTPLYVYNEDSLHEAADELLKMKSVDRIFYSIKANPNPQIIRLFAAKGLGFECVSPGEVEHILTLLPELDRRRILFTPNFAARAEYEKAFAWGVIVTLDNLYPLERWPDAFREREIFVRIDPGRGRGHHDFVRTAGSHSKFGVSPEQIGRLKKLAKDLRVRIVGLHAHTGSGILTPGNWKTVASFLATLIAELPTVRVLDLGGGLGVVEKPGQLALDLAQVEKSLLEVRQAYPQLELWLEPGRFLVAQAGVLLAKVTQLKRKKDYTFVGVDVGMNTLLRPALYGSYHEIVNLSAAKGARKIKANIVGPICETGDVLGHDRLIAEPTDGHVFLVATVGAYGRAMSSHYNLRPPAAEHVLPKRVNG